MIHWYLNRHTFLPQKELKMNANAQAYINKRHELMSSDPENWDSDENLDILDILHSKMTGEEIIELNDYYHSLTNTP